MVKILKISKRGIKLRDQKTRSWKDYSKKEKKFAILVSIIVPISVLIISILSIFAFKYLPENNYFLILLILLIIILFTLYDILKRLKRKL